MSLTIERPLRVDGVLRLALFDAERCPTAEAARRELRRESSAVLRVEESHNLIVTSGLNALAAALFYNFTWGTSGFPGSSANANLSTVYLAVGTGTTAAALTQTQLAAEVARQALTNGAVAGAQGVYDSFFPTNSGNATIWEIGTFLQASGAANSGVMFDRTVLGASVSKTASNTALAELSLTLSN